MFPEPDWPVLRRYDADHLRRIALPVGGIGTGTISFTGSGALRDVEIANRPAKGFTPDVCSLVVRVAGPSTPPAFKALQGPLDPMLYEGMNGAQVPEHGLPRFRHAAFATTYPFGRVELSDATFPVLATVEAWNPFVPTDADASGLPVMVLSVGLRNTTEEPLEVSVAASLRNLIGAMRLRPAVEPVGNHNEVRIDARVHGVQLAGGGDPDHEDAGSIALAVLDGTDVSIRTSWAPDRWGSSRLDFADDLLADGRLDERDGQPDRPVGSVCEHRTLTAGASTTVSVLIGWRFPNRLGWAGSVVDPATVGNYYATRWPDAWSVVTDAAARLPELRRRTLTFVRAICSADLPAEVVEAALANVSTLRTQTCFRTPDGRFFAWEGCKDDDGWCHGTCTHVWNYEHATPVLFGELSRSMREVEFAHATDERGLMSFRVGLPLADRAHEWGWAAADGQLGCLVKLHRDWRLAGDDSMLTSLWPAARRALEFCWIADGWDADADGVMDGVQHNTMDVEYHGPNPQMQGWYLAALRAGEEMSRAQGDGNFADRCRRLFDYGSTWMDEHLFDGEYYEHHVAPGERAAPGLVIDGTDDDPGAPQMQLGAGCLVDQLVGQYAAHLAGLGRLHDPAHVATTLHSIVRHNRRSGFHDHDNVMRSYALGDETAVLMASYPHGDRPVQPFSYFTEVMTGFEYTLAAGLVQEGDEDEALQVVRDIRARYDGFKRSPFDEAECGHHYARAMASWSLVLACSGLDYDGRSGVLRVGSARGRRRHLITTGDAWGTCVVAEDGRDAVVEIAEGSLLLRRLVVDGIGAGDTDACAPVTAGTSVRMELRPLA